MTSSTKVWDRHTGDPYANVMSKNAFMALVTLFMLAGVGFCALVSTVSHNWDLGSWTWYEVLGFFAACFGVTLFGTWLFNKSPKPLVSATGYALVAGPFGLLIGPVLAEYSPDSIGRALIATLTLTAFFGLMGVAIPENLDKWYTIAFQALVVLLVGMLIVPFLGAGAMHLWDWVGIVIFSGLLVLDFNRAAHVDRTLDNAIDSAATIFLDVLNIFLRFLGINGKD